MKRFIPAAAIVCAALIFTSCSSNEDTTPELVSGGQTTVTSADNSISDTSGAMAQGQTEDKYFITYNGVKIVLGDEVAPVVKAIGKESNGVAVKDEKIKTGNYVIFGFGVQAGKRYGISSIYCYYMHKYDYGIVKTGGFLQLRAKLKVNKEFSEQVEAIKNTLNDKHKLVLMTCGFPDSIFAEIAAFLIAS